MNRVRLCSLDAPRNLTSARQRQTQSWIRGNAKRWKPLGRQEVDCNAEFSGAAGNRGQGTDDAIDLRMPSVRCNQYAHGVRLCSLDQRLVESLLGTIAISCLNGVTAE